MPRRVTSVVPMRRPLGRSQSCGVSLGSRFLLVIRLAAASRWATSRPPPNSRTSAITWCVRGEALVRAEDGDAAGVQRVRERLGVGDDGGHVLRAELEQLGRGGGERGDAVDLVGGGERGEDGVQQRRRELEVVPHHHARLRAGERLAGAAGQHRGALAPAGPGTGRRRSGRAGGRRRRRPCRPTPARCRRSRARGAGRGSCYAPSAISFGLRLPGRAARTRRGRPRARAVSNGTSTMFRPRMPAGPSWRLLECAADGLRDRHHRVAGLVSAA